MLKVLKLQNNKIEKIHFENNFWCVKADDLKIDWLKRYLFYLRNHSKLRKKCLRNMKPVSNGQLGQRKNLPIPIY